MAENVTDDILILCTRPVNISCWHNHVKLKNDAYAKQMTPVTVMMIIFMVVGLLGNSLVITMYSARKQRTSANTFIMFLAGIDLFACVAIHPYITYKIFNFYNQTWTAACKFFEFLVHVNLLMSGLTLMLISVDRFLAICRPIKYLKFDQHIMKAIAATCLLSIISSVPILEFYGPNPTEFDIDNGVFVGYSCHYQEKYVGSMAMGLFSAFIVCGFLVVIIAMSMLYKSVAVVAYKSRRRVGPLSNAHTLAGFSATKFNSSCSGKSNASSMVTQTINVSPPCSPESQITSFIDTYRQATTHGGKLNDSSTLFCVTSSCEPASSRKPKNTRDRYTLNAVSSNPYPEPSGQLTAKRLKAAKILFLVTFVFFLSWLPFFILRICNFFRDDKCHPTSYVGEILDTMMNHVFYINNAINPILYTVINKTFRQECRKLLGKRFRCNL